MVNKFNDTFICHIPEEEREAMMRLGSIDGAMWRALVDLNKHFEIGVNFNKIEHSELIVEAREALMEVLKTFK